MLKRPLHLLWLTPLALAGLVLFLVVDANLQHWLGRNWLPAACIGLMCLSVLVRWLADRPRINPVAPPMARGKCA
jgi:hypothetical protein